MAKAAVRDQYSNKFYGTVVESAANTLTFSEINTNVSVFDKVGWVLNRLEWYCTGAVLGLVLNSADGLEFALTSSNNITDLGLNNPSVIDVLNHVGIAPLDNTSLNLFDMPIIRDFSMMPGGGLIIAPRPLYVAVKGTSLASAATIAVRGYFRQIAMTADDYIELVDFYRIVS